MVFSGGFWNRVKSGIPQSWGRIQKWFDKSSTIFFPTQAPPQVFSKKCPEVPSLTNYNLPPPVSFWSSFPHRALPSQPVTPLDVTSLSKIISEVEHILQPHQVKRAGVLLYELEHGVTVPFSHQLQSISVKNTPSVYEFGVNFTDTVATWVKKGFVAGPFSFEPMQIYRLNSMIAVDQKTKIRIVMNLSGPKGDSFNDAIDTVNLEKVNMSSARNFGYSVVDCGPGSRMWKYDQTDAYKNLPARTDDVLLQGFSWLGCMFFETQQAFGSKAAVAAFDRLGKTVLDVSKVLTNFPAHLVHRTLDDLPFVTPKDSVIGEIFAETYKKVCSDSNIVLVTSCPNNDKAFEDETFGTVLGIRFDTVKMLWSISRKKKDTILSRIRPLVCGEYVNLHQVQQLVGSLNDFGQMCQIMRGMKHPILEFMAQFQEQEDIHLKAPEPVISDLICWAAAISEAEEGLPIPHRSPNASEAEADLIFVSDAAGARFSKINGRFIPFGDADGRGGASISEIDGEIWFHSQIEWPENFLFVERDKKDHAYGCKSSTLEVIALLLPFLTIPQLLYNKRILLLTDNESVVFGWSSKKLRNDVSASIFIRALHLISFFLGCHIHVSHLPRISTNLAVIADSLTRDSTTTEDVIGKLQSASSYAPPQILYDWLAHPNENWDFAFDLLDYVVSIC
jgi:hypothetical protein